MNVLLKVDRESVFSCNAISAAPKWRELSLTYSLLIYGMLLECNVDLTSIVVYTLYLLNSHVFK